MSLCALVVVGARGGSKRPAGSVEFEQPTADVEPVSDVTVLNDADFTKYQGLCLFYFWLQYKGNIHMIEGTRRLKKF